MGPIHKRLSLKFQVLICVISICFGGILTASSFAKDAPPKVDESKEIHDIIQRASKKQNFSKEMKLIVQKDEKALPILIEVFQDSARIWQERWFSGMALSKFPLEKTKPVLIKGMDDPLSIMRSVSIQSASANYDDDFRKAIQKKLGDSSLLVRDSAVKALGKYKDRSAVDLLAKELFNQHNYYRGEPMFGIRENIVKALGDIESMKGVEPLIKVMQQEANGKLRKMACDAMEKIVRPQVVLNEGYKVPACPDHWLNWYKENQTASNKK